MPAAQFSSVAIPFENGELVNRRSTPTHAPLPLRRRLLLRRLLLLKDLWLGPGLLLHWNGLVGVLAAMHTGVHTGVVVAAWLRRRRLLIEARAWRVAWAGRRVPHAWACVCGGSTQWSGQEARAWIACRWRRPHCRRRSSLGSAASGVAAIITAAACAGPVFLQLRLVVPLYRLHCSQQASNWDRRPPARERQRWCGAV